MREWGHLHLCLVEEFEEYALLPGADAGRSRRAPGAGPAGQRGGQPERVPLHRAAAGRVGHAVRVSERTLERTRQLEREQAELVRARRTTCAAA